MNPKPRYLAALAAALVMLAFDAGAAICQKPDGTYTDRCTDADRPVDVSGRGFTHVDPQAAARHSSGLDRTIERQGRILGEARAAQERAQDQARQDRAESRADQELVIQRDLVGVLRDAVRGHGRGPGRRFYHEHGRPR